MRNKLALNFVFQGLLGFYLIACSSNIDSNNSKANLTSTTNSQTQQNIVSSAAKQNKNEENVVSDISTQNKTTQETFKTALDSIKQKLLLEEISVQQAEIQLREIRDNSKADAETATLAQNLIMELKQKELDKQDILLENNINIIETSFANGEIGEAMRDSKIYATKKQILKTKISITQSMIQESDNFKKLLKSKINKVT